MVSEKSNKRKLRQPFVLGGLVLLVAVLFFLDLNAGYTAVSLSDMWDLITGNASPALRLAIVNFRLPRVLMSLLVGLALSVSGCVLQGVTRNELADPGVLGINAGAGLMAALFITVFSQSLQNTSAGLFAAAFLGGAATAVGVYLLANQKITGPPPARLVLTGVAVATAVNALTIMLLLRMRQEEYGFIAGWLAGNIWGSNWANIKIVAPLIVILLLVLLFRANTLNVLALGPQTATGLGASVRRDSLVLLSAAVALSSLCVAVGGGISFVGLICPHLVRRLVGSRHQILLPATALVGAALLLLSDLIGRTLIAPDEIPIGVVATIIGTPYFLYLLVNKRRR